MSAPEKTILAVLQQALQIESDGCIFYSLVAEKASKPAVREIFAKLAADEVVHKDYLQTVAASYEDRGALAFQVELKTPDLRLLSDRVFSEKFRTEARGAAFEVSALSIGMQLESRAIATYTAAAAQAIDPPIQQFYRFLTLWEQQHLDALHALYEGVRNDFWTQAGFEPF